MSSFPQLESNVKAWITAVSKQQLGGANLAADLKSGAKLCNLVNALKPGTILAINEYSAAFRQLENINAFISAAKMLGVAEADIFQAEDLQKDRNIPRVLVCIVALAAAANAAGLTSQTIASDSVAEARAAAASIGSQNAANPAMKPKSGRNLSLFEEQQARAQKEASNASRGNIIKSNDSSYSGQSSMSFAEASMARAQKEASKANTSARGRNIVQVTDGAGSQSTLSFTETKQAEAQKQSSDALNQKSSTVRSTHKASGTGLNFVETKQAEAQKLASAGHNTKHNIARVGDQGAGSNVLSMAENSQMDAQRLASSAKTGGHNIARLDNVTDSNAIAGPTVVASQQ